MEPFAKGAVPIQLLVLPPPDSLMLPSLHWPRACTLANQDLPHHGDQSTNLMGLPIMITPGMDKANRPNHMVLCPVGGRLWAVLLWPLVCCHLLEESNMSILPHTAPGGYKNVPFYLSDLQSIIIIIHQDPSSTSTIHYYHPSSPSSSIIILHHRQLSSSWSIITSIIHQVVISCYNIWISDVYVQ